MIITKRQTIPFPTGDFTVDIKFEYNDKHSEELEEKDKRIKELESENEKLKRKISECPECSYDQTADLTAEDLKRAESHTGFRYVD